MIDFGVLEAIKNLLSEDEFIKKEGLADHIYVHISPITKNPMILLELEEIWTLMPEKEQLPYTLVKLKSSLLNLPIKNKEDNVITHKIELLLNEKKLALKEGKLSISRIVRNSNNNLHSLYEQSIEVHIEH